MPVLDNAPPSPDFRFGYVDDRDLVDKEEFGKLFCVSPVIFVFGTENEAELRCVGNFNPLGNLGKPVVEKAVAERRLVAHRKRFWHPVKFADQLVPGTEYGTPLKHFAVAIQNTIGRLMSVNVKSHVMHSKPPFIGCFFVRPIAYPTWRLAS